MASCWSSTVSKFPAGGSYEYFLEEFLFKNRLCVFDEALTSQWPSRRLWVDQHGQPNLHHLNTEYGGYTVPVADCAREQFSAHPKSEMKMSDYLTYWSELMKKREQPQEEDEPCKLLYLKDWHLARETGPDVFYTTPLYFQSDWLNEVWLVRNDVEDDYRFVYMGPKGTWTPFHADVFKSYSWSANICGTKEWLLYPPGQEEHLRDRLGNLPFDVTSADLEDERRYPNASKACEPIRVIQKAGETIFVPSGWYHQVKNLEDTISINHNWTNAFGVKFMWKHLQNELKLVCEELADCRAMDGWEEQCQVVLRACAGMDYWEMAQLLCVIGLPRLNKTRSLLSFLHLSSDALSDIEENFSKIMKSSRKWTFFDSGVFPTELQLQPCNCVVDNITTCDQPTTQGSVRYESVPLPTLLHLLPKSFQDVLAAFSKASFHLTRQRTIAQMTYTLFELYTINDVLEEVVHSLDN